MKEKNFHPFEPFVNESTKKLIIGTIPPPCFRKNKRGDDVFGDISRRCEFLLRNCG